MRYWRWKRVFCLALIGSLMAASLLLSHTWKYNTPVEVLPTQALEVMPLPDLSPAKGQMRSLSYAQQENITWSEAVRGCRPVHNIAFVKIHKAGSSTVANILQRYGLTHGLNFALPNKKVHAYAYNYISKPGELLTKQKIIPLARGQEYNILFHHAIYNRTAFRDIMPADTVYITILREPFQQFVSAFEYYNVVRAFASRQADLLNSTNPISAYLANPVKYELGLRDFSYIKNKQAQDLGMTRTELLSPDKQQEYISQLDRDFSLVMIMEYFDESLLLLKRQLCWDTKDVLYMPRNANSRKPNRNFTSLDYQRHRDIGLLDYSLYAHYLSIFQETMRRMEDDFFQELAHFKQLLGKTQESCLHNTLLYVSQTTWHSAFNVTQDDCELMMIPELAALDKLFARAASNTQANLST